MSSLDKRALWYGTAPEALRPLARLVGTPLDFQPYNFLWPARSGRTAMYGVAIPMATAAITMQASSMFLSRFRVAER